MLRGVAGFAVSGSCRHAPVGAVHSPWRQARGLIPCCHSQDPTPALTTDSGAVDVNTLPGSRDHSVATASGLTRPCFQDAAVAP